MLSTEARQAIEQRWISRANEKNLKPGTKTYAKAEVEFFAGVMTAIDCIFPNERKDMLSNAVPAIWVMNAISGRPIVNREKKS